MDDFNQIEVPPSFVALYTTPGGHRLTRPMADIRKRYELCEDMAQMLTEQAGAALFKSQGSGQDVLGKIVLALSGPESALEPAEPGWVVTRLAELLGWAAPRIAQPD
jgi:hypothetical protein